MRAYVFAILATGCVLTSTAWADDPSLDGKATGSFKRTPLELVIKQIQKQTETNLVLAPGVDRGASVNMVVRDEKLSDVLDTLAKRHKLRRTAFAGAWVLHAKGAKIPQAATPKGKGSRALGLPLTVDYNEEPVSVVIKRVKARTKLDVTLPASVRLRLRRTGTTISLRLYRVTAAQLVDHLAFQTGLTWKLEAGRIVFAATKTAAAPKGAGELTMETQGNADVGRLVARLSSNSTASRDAAVRELVLVGKSCLSAVAKVLDGTGKNRPKDPACSAALRVIADLGESTPYPSVLKVFEDKTRPVPVRVAAGETLGAMGATQAIGDLILALDDGVSLLRAESARRALVMIGKPAVAPLLKRYRVEVKRRKPRWGIVYRGLFIMGEVPTKETTAELMNALKTVGTNSRAKSIRHHAAIGLGMTNDPKVIPFLVTALEDERDFLIVKYITRSLTWLTDEKFPPDAVAWRAWWDGPGTRKFASTETAEELLQRLAGGPIELEKTDKGRARLDESTEARLKRLIAQLGHANKTKVRSAESDLQAMGRAALPDLRKAAAREGAGAKHAAALVILIEGSSEE
ncbi:MAG: HEAT repeat domain-containing protein [Planctomycetes bacterium]|nr:HEAT repeat domain-containing protein [Planctomycetota bacterium]